MFIELTTVEGKRSLVNLDKIQEIGEDLDTSHIWFEENGIEVRQSYDYIKKAISLSPDCFMCVLDPVKEQERETL